MKKLNYIKLKENYRTFHLKKIVLQFLVTFFCPIHFWRDFIYKIYDEFSSFNFLCLFMFKGIPFIKLKFLSFFIARYLTISLRGPGLNLTARATARVVTLKMLFCACGCVGGWVCELMDRRKKKYGLLVVVVVAKKVFWFCSNVIRFGIKSYFVSKF